MQSVWNEKCIISPSLICLDMCNLESQVKILEESGIKMLHVDILDGHFSPSMPLGLDTVRQLRAKTSLQFDCHVMVTEQDYFVDELLDIGVEQIVFHGETQPHIDGMLNRLSDANNQIVDNISNLSATTEEVTEATTEAEAEASR